MMLKRLVVMRRGQHELIRVLGGVLLALTLHGTVALTQPLSLRTVAFPIDEAGSDPQLLATRAAVLGAVFARDGRMLRHLGATAPRTLNLIDLAIAQMHASDGYLLNAIESLAYGGMFTDPTHARFCGPYWGTHQSVYDRDGFALDYATWGDGMPWVIVVPGTVIRREPSTSSTVVYRPQLEFVGIDNAGTGEGRGFYPVQLGKIRGFIQASAVRESRGNHGHVCFDRNEDGWHLSSIVLEDVSY